MPTGSGGGIVAAVPGPIGGTTSNTGQFTKLAVGTSVPTLPTNAGDASILNSLGVGVAADGTAAHLMLGTSGTILTSAGALVLSPNNNQINSGGNIHLNIGRATLFNGDGGVSGSLTLNPQTFGSLPAAAAGNKGTIACVTDSTTNVWGATITGTGANNVLAFSNGTNWTVAGK